MSDAMSMWLQTRNVRHLVTSSPLQTLCRATPRMWFDNNPGHGRFVFDSPHSTAPANLNIPLCAHCRKALAQLNQDAR